MVEAGTEAEVEVDVAAGVGVTVDAVVKGSCASDGHGSPGRSMKVEFKARAFCVSMFVVALGLMTPTIP